MSENPKLSGIKACVFDAYGTLFDAHSAVGRHRERLGDRADQVSAVWRTKQLEYTWLRSLMGHHADFWQVTQDRNDPNILFAVLMDPNVLTPMACSVNLKRGNATGRWAVYDQFGSQDIPLGALQSESDQVELPMCNQGILVVHNNRRILYHERGQALAFPGIY